MCSSKANHQPSLSKSLIITISKFQIMKKIYISPESIEVRLMSSAILAESVERPNVTVSDDDDDTVDADKVDVKTFTSKNLWDNEW